MVKKNKIIICICLVILLIVCNEKIINAEKENFNLHAYSALLMDGNNGRVLWESKGFEEKAMASTTKIMTCIIALEYGNLEDTVTISKRASSAPEVKLFVKENEKYYLKDLLYALMLESSNDAAVAIAEQVGGSVESFCEMMTDKAKEIGAYNTSYKTPNGLDAEGHYTTAYDLALIARYALNNDKFVEVINTKYWQFKEISNKRSFLVNNKNAFLNMMEGAIGVKTGFTSQAGYCFVGAIKNEKQYFISVVLASGWPPNKTWKWNDTQKIMKYAIDNYNYKDIISGNEKIPDIKVIDGKKDKVAVMIDQSYGMLVKEDESIKKQIVLPKEIEAPIDNDYIVGYVNISVDDKILKKIPLKAKGTIEKIDYAFCLDKLVKWFFR